MARFYMNIEHKPNVTIEFTEDVKDTCKPIWGKIFGVRFLASERIVDGNCIYEFEADEDDYDIAAELLRMMERRAIVKSVCIDINHN